MSDNPRGTVVQLENIVGTGTLIGKAVRGQLKNHIEEDNTFAALAFTVWTFYNVSAEAGCMGVFEKHFDKFVMGVNIGINEATGIKR